MGEKRRRWLYDQYGEVTDHNGNTVSPVDDDYGYYKSTTLSPSDDDWCKYDDE